MTRIDFLWQQLISCEKNWILVTRINFLWQELISCHKNQFWYPLNFKIDKSVLIHKIRFYKAPAGPWITLSWEKYWLCPNFVHIFFKYILARINLPPCGSKWISKIWNWTWTVFGPVWTCFDPHWTCFGPGSSFLWTVFGPDWTCFGPGSRFVFINP